MLYLYNTLSKQKEEFKPLDDKKVGMYTCGPTVYNYPHIGNYRAYIFSDLLKRHLKHSGYSVKHVMNLTDVDDKTITGSQKENKTLEEFTEFYSEEFFKDLDKLNIEKADVVPKATEHVNEMAEITERLLNEGIAYKGDDGSIYFDISKARDYGKLSGIDLETLKGGASGRVKKDEYAKEDAHDFALWKAYDSADGDVFWEPKLGKGRPGWHIECSAMSMKYLGESFDIHTGGIDLVFPHHENEIAQSEYSTHKPFVKYWLHNEWLLVNGRKMSKSLGNQYTIRDIEKKGFLPLAYRYLALQTHYRKPMNFTWESLEAAQTALKKIQSFFLANEEIAGAVDKNYRAKFREAMDNDLDSAQALAVAWEVLKDPNVFPENKRATLLDFDKVLGFGLDKLKKLEVPDDVSKLIEEREGARKNSDWKRSDELRERIKDMGFEVKDTEAGPKISKI
jgi:cysteinyl-tRNA synthetase